jgi:uncharacterized protein (TIGR02996 family)
MNLTDEQPFLDAVFANYHEDGPRLVYADYLDANGEPERAELVRLQLALARMSEDHPRRAELTERKTELISAHSARWTEHLHGLVTEVEFRRGVPDSAVVDAEQFLATGEELRRRMRLRRLSLRNDTGVLPKLVESPLLAGIPELDFCGNDLGPGGVAVLTRSRQFGQLEALDLGFTGLDDSAVKLLAGCSHFPALRILALNNNEHITAEGLSAFAESPFYAGLISLDVSSNEIGPPGLQAIRDSRTLVGLTTLQVSGNPIGDEGFMALATTPVLKRMIHRQRQLQFRKCELGPESISTLLKSTDLELITSLDLTGNEIGDRGFTELVNSPKLKHLRILKLGRNQITDSAITSLRPQLQTFLQRLRILDLSENRLTRLGLGMLIAARGESAVQLDISANVQASTDSMVPVTVGEMVPMLLRSMTEIVDTAELRRRVAYPTLRVQQRPETSL